MKNFTTAIFALISIIAIIPLLLIYSTFSWGFVGFKAYNWFILTNWSAMPILTLTQVICIMLTIRVFTHKAESQHLKKEYKDDSQFWIGIIFSPWLSLATLWILHKFI